MRALAIQNIILIILALVVLIAGVVIISKLSSNASTGISRLENISTSTASDILGKCALLSSKEIKERCEKKCNKYGYSYKGHELTERAILCVCEDSGGNLNEIWVDC